MSQPTDVESMFILFVVNLTKLPIWSSKRSIDTILGLSKILISNKSFKD